MLDMVVISVSSVLGILAIRKHGSTYVALLAFSENGNFSEGR